MQEERQQKKAIQKPKVVVQYMIFMKGVDRAGQYHSVFMKGVDWAGQYHIVFMKGVDRAGQYHSVFMKGVDRAGQYHSYYSILRITVKWSKKVVLYLLNCALFNAFFVYRTLNTNKKVKYKNCLHNVLRSWKSEL
jgi:hypothetical protein